MWTSIFQEVVNYYNHNGANVYACLVDASKTFDRINCSKLFQAVLKRKLPGTMIRLLFDSYTRQQSFVKWGTVSDVIYTQNGVKQGGVLSATLFCIYMDELISRLEHFGICFYIGNEYYGFLHDRPWISPWIKSISNEWDITCHVFASQWSGHCDVIVNRLWRHQQSVKRVSKTRGWCVKILVFSVIFWICYVL